MGFNAYNKITQQIRNKGTIDSKRAPIEIPHG